MDIAMCLQVGPIWLHQSSVKNFVSNCVQGIKVIGLENEVGHLTCSNNDVNVVMHTYEIIWGPN